MNVPLGRFTEKIPIGMRTVKTALAVSASPMIIEHYGSSPAKVVFATIGAISAVGPTFTASLLACLTQICVVLVGALLGLALMALKVPDIVGVDIRVVAIMAGYQAFKLNLVPVLPCLVLVNVCLNPEIQTLSYSMGRLWDAAIGLTVGILVNTLIFPYDNSRKIRQIMKSLDRDLFEMLEDLFDGDEHRPQAENLAKKLDILEGQLVLFAEQQLLWRKRQKQEMNRLSPCKDIDQDLLVEVAALCRMDNLEHLNREKSADARRP